MLSRVQLFCNLMDCSPPRLLCPWDFPGKNTGVPFPSPGDLLDPGIKLTSPALAGRLFTTEAPEKPLMAMMAQKINIKTILI